jgi:hypothetical protein
MKKFVATMLVVGLMAVVAQAGAVNYSFDETVSGTWEVSVTVTGTDTAGLSAYGFYVNNTAGVSYVENTLNVLGPDYQPDGFLSPVSGYIGADFNAGNYQGSAAAIQGIGIVPVYQAPPTGVPVPPVDLAVPALLGTLTTPGGLGAGDFATDGAGLLNLAADGFLSELTVTQEVNPIPEPMTLSLLAIGGCLVAIKRKRS